MNLNYQRRPTGLCHTCRRSTALFVHQGCGGKPRRSAARPMTARRISAIVKAAGA